MDKLLVLILFISFSVAAEIEKKAFTCEQANGLCFMWWPKLPKIDGWQQDIGNSQHYKVNAQALSGFTFSTSEVVIYANAVYQHDKMPYKSLNDFIKYSQSQFTKGSYPVKIVKSEVLKSSSNISFHTYTFIPEKHGNWEYVSYAEEIDDDGNKYYLIFTLSSRTESGYKKYIKDYFSFIKQYK
jgi:hypothetical protein